MQPLLSIVIANYNYGRFLAEAIESVFSQGMDSRIELIICDGASTDNSVQIIKRYEKHLAWWCSEPDGGQSAAFNKGFAHATGRFLTWLNADDVLMPGTLKAFERAVDKHPECQWFVGGVMWLAKDMRVIKMGRGRHFSEMRFKCGDVNVWGPSSFFSKELFDSVGGVDERFRYGMDSDLWLKFAAKANERYLPFCRYAWGLRLHEDAKMSGHNFTADGEYRAGTTALVDPSSKKWEQLAREAEMLHEIFVPKIHMNFWRQLISMDFRRSFLARLDTQIYKGRHYLEYFK